MNTFNFHELELSSGVTIKNSLHNPDDSCVTRWSDIVFNGKLAWRVADTFFRVISVDTGAEVAYLDLKYHRDCPPLVTAVAEVKFYKEMCVLAIGIDYKCDGGYPILKLFSVRGSKVIGTWEICEKITCIYEIEQSVALHIELCYQLGTLAVGTAKGKIFCFDMQLPVDARALHRLPDYKEEMFNVMYEKDYTYYDDKRAKVLLKRYEGDISAFFALQLHEIPYENESIEEGEEIRSMVLLPLPLLLAVGLLNGRMVLYDLRNLEITRIIKAPDPDPYTNTFALNVMSYIEPLDDPGHVLYVWALYKSKKEAKAVLYFIDFKSRGVYEGEEIFENYKGSYPRLTLPIEDENVYPMSCQIISRPLTENDDDMMKLCIISLASLLTNQTYIMLFDLNKYYSEWCPRTGNWKDNLPYAPVFLVDQDAWGVHFDENSVTTFDSFDRSPEHSLPLSLSFDLIALTASRIQGFSWLGVQSKALANYNLVGPLMILEPSYYFKEMLDVHLKPKFSNIKYQMSTEIEKKREFLLTLALEYNRIDFIKKCIWAWSNGAMLSAEPKAGVSLSTLTNWIWRRVQMMKDYCNQNCTTLFDFSGIRIEDTTQRYLSSCYRQLKVLSELLGIIMKDHRKYIPDDIYSSLEQKARSIEVNSDFQEVLQWLLNVGLLPEGRHDHRRLKYTAGDEEFVIVPYPYEVIKKHYEETRRYVTNEKEFFEESGDKNRNLLYIDVFIANECDGKVVNAWKNNYPPRTIQELLRTLLIEDLSIEKKGILFIYFFMDMANILNETVYSNIVKNLIKFPTVFNINSAVIKQTQAYWHLDNGHFDMAVDEAISPLTNEREIPRWMRELMITLLLKNNAYPLALKVLRCPGTTIRPMLELAVLLLNNLFNEAYFHQQKCDRAVKDEFLRFIIETGEKGISQLLGISFDEEEAIFFHKHLEKSGLSKSFNIHFVSLVRDSKYTEAAKLVEEVERAGNDVDTEQPKHILGAFMSLLDPTTRKITHMTSSGTSSQTPGVSFPDTFSASVIMKGCSSTRNIYKRCIESINQAVGDENVLDHSKKAKKEVPFLGYPKLGIFEYRRQQKGLKNNAIGAFDMDDEDDSSSNAVNMNGKRHLERSDELQSQTKRLRMKESDYESDRRFNQFLDNRISHYVDKKLKPKSPAPMPSTYTATTSSNSHRSRMSLNAILDMLEETESSIDETSDNLNATSKKENALEKYLTPSPRQREASTRVQIACPTPKQIQMFTEYDEGDESDTLATPIVKKRVPFRNIAVFVPPPPSILKTRSDRGSVSPTPSRTSEFGETKSVKSITFAEIQDSRESSFAHDSSNHEGAHEEQMDTLNQMDEQMDSSNHEELLSEGAHEEQMDSSNEKYHSPENISSNDVQEASPTFLTQGPKARPSINSSFKENASTSLKESANASINASSNSSCPFLDIFEQEEKLVRMSEKFSLGTITDSSDTESNKAYYNLPNLSTLNESSENDDNSSKSSDKNFDDDEEIADDEHFEEEELPEHSDYEEDKKKYAYGGIDIESSESSDQSLANVPAKKIQNDVIEIEDSDDGDDVIISESSPPTTTILPPFSAVQNEVQQATDFIELKNQAMEERATDDMTMTYQKFDVEYPARSNVNDQTDTVKLQTDDKQVMEKTAIEVLLGLKNNQQGTSEKLIEKEISSQSEQEQVPTKVEEKKYDQSDLPEEVADLLCDNEVETFLEEKPATEQFIKSTEHEPSTSQSQPQKLRPFSVPNTSEGSTTSRPKEWKRPSSGLLYKKLKFATVEEVDALVAEKLERYRKGFHVDNELSPLLGVRITRSKSQSLSQENRGLAPQPPQTPTRSKSRAASEASDSAKKPSRRRSTDVQTTPVRRQTRSVSRDVEETLIEPKAKTPRRDLKKGNNDEGESSRRRPSVEKQLASQILEEPSVSTRRTTRSQLSNVEEKPISIQSTMSPQRAKKSQNPKNVESADESGDNESVSSVSSSRTRRKRKSSTQSDSSTASKRKSPSHELSIIPEENTEDIRLALLSAQKQKKK